MNRKRRSKVKSNRLGILMILPALTLIILLMIYPLIQGIIYSFTNFRLNKPKVAMEFIGIENYVRVFTDSKFFESLLFTLIYAVGVVAISYVLGFICALLLNRKLPVRGLFRSLILLPWIISYAVMATNWQWLLNDRYGIVNILLQKIGIIDEPLLFFVKPLLAQCTVIFVGAWKALPFMTIVILAGMQSISVNLYEAAVIDGAGFFSTLRYITLPGIHSITVMCTTLQFIWMVNNFEGIYLFTEGGPTKATYTSSIYIYTNAFGYYETSYASAMGVIMLLLMAVLTFVRFAAQKRAEGN